ncbi:MAG: AraC family transcriptional regulator ligand-binding domain-containing protein [Gammaproteobacteria bacterium]|nr:AraC family transcriptional regulator ligand-binding domain-containing protein [Gammaproteobacteria bacterium]
MNGRRWFDSQDKVVPLAGVPRLLIELAERRGAPRPLLLRGTGIFDQDLRQPGHCISADQLLRLVANARRLAQGADLPFLLGHRLVGAQGGPLAELLHASPDLRRALVNLGRFRALWQPLMTILVQWSAERIHLQLLPVVELGDEATFIQDCLLTALAALIRQGLRQPPQLQVQLGYDAPRQLAQHQQHLGQHLEFGAACTGLSLARHHLQQRWPDHCPADYQQQLALCRQLWRPSAHSIGLLEWTLRWQRRHLRPHLRQNLTIDHCAAAAGVSTATLKRCLQRQGTSYQQLGDELRKQLALHRLATSLCSNEQLAHELGYSDGHNFRRSCKRWTGLLPSMLRQV